MDIPRFARMTDISTMKNQCQCFRFFNTILSYMYTSKEPSFVTHSLLRHAQQTSHGFQLGKMATHICSKHHFNNQMSKIPLKEYTKLHTEDFEDESVGHTYIHPL